jgi:hypothetical protein
MPGISAVIGSNAAKFLTCLNDKLGNKLSTHHYLNEVRQFTIIDKIYFVEGFYY